MRTFKPEGNYAINRNTVMEDVAKAFKLNEPITGLVLGFDKEEKTLEVYLGEKVRAKMPWKESTLYDFTYKKRKEEDIPDQVLMLFHKRIRAKITSINKNGTIILSRKANMIEAWDFISCNFDNYVYNARIINKTEVGVFFDIADGLIAFCHVKDFSPIAVRLMEWAKIGEVYDVVLVERYETELKQGPYRLRCSKKKASKTDIKNIYHNMIVDVKIGDEVRDGNSDGIKGFWAEITPNIAGIANINAKAVLPKYGDTVEAIVTRISGEKKHIHLDII